jgi:hypothetical protein
MAHARQALAQAEGILAEASQHKEGMRDAIAAKDQEVSQLKHRWVLGYRRFGPWARWFGSWARWAGSWARN